MSKQFETNGYEVFPGLFTGEEVDAVRRTIDGVLEARPMNVVVDCRETGARTVLGRMTPEVVRRGRMKVNDLYLTEPAIRQMALNDKLVPLLSTRMRHAPMLCNSLYLQTGSAQPAHIDSLYMTPRTRKRLIAAWVALEDTHADAGELEYFPGSHLIPPYRFKDGSYHATPEEEPTWRAYIEAEVDRRGLEKRTFAAKKGDVFLWEADFLHGGGPINDPNRTRRSLVFHYFARWDFWREWPRRLGKGYWFDRPPQPVPAG